MNTTVSKSKPEDEFRAFDLGIKDKALKNDMDDLAPAEAVEAAEMSVRRFLFGYDFDAPEEEKKKSEAGVDSQLEETEENLPPPPMFSEEDLEIAREEGRVLGHAQGLKDAEESALHFLVLAVESVADQMSQIYESQKQADLETHKMAAALSMTIVQKVLPTYVRDHGANEVETLVQECIPHILNEPRLILRVSPENEGPMRERIEPMTRNRGFEGAVVIMADPALGPADCRLEWDNGGAERRVDSLLQHIQAIVDRNAEGILQQKANSEETAQHNSAEMPNEPDQA